MTGAKKTISVIVHELLRRGFISITVLVNFFQKKNFRIKLQLLRFLLIPQKINLHHVSFVIIFGQMVVPRVLSTFDHKTQAHFPTHRTFPDCYNTCRSTHTAIYGSTVFSNVSTLPIQPKSLQPIPAEPNPTSPNQTATTSHCNTWHPAILHRAEPNRTQPSNTPTSSRTQPNRTQPNRNQTQHPHTHHHTHTHHTTPHHTTPHHTHTTPHHTTPHHATPRHATPRHTTPTPHHTTPPHHPTTPHHTNHPTTPHHTTPHHTTPHHPHHTTPHHTTPHQARRSGHPTISPQVPTFMDFASVWWLLERGPTLCRVMSRDTAPENEAWAAMPSKRSLSSTPRAAHAQAVPDRS